jgi:hypothetical protein
MRGPRVGKYVGILLAWNVSWRVQAEALIGSDFPLYLQVSDLSTDSVDSSTSGNHTHLLLYTITGPEKGLCTRG